jgi:hypothetical protein
LQVRVLHGLPFNSMTTFLTILAIMAAPVLLPIALLALLVGLMMWTCLAFAFITPFIPASKNRPSLKGELPPCKVVAKKED